MAFGEHIFRGLDDSAPFETAVFRWLSERLQYIRRQLISTDSCSMLCKTALRQPFRSIPDDLHVGLPVAKS